jgi:hypothetical protein
VTIGSDAIAAALVAAGLALLIAVGVYLWRRSRVSPDEIERRRRQLLLATGKMGDANLLDFHDHVLVYSYDVRGVEYTATQDVSRLTEYLPESLELMAGPVIVRYDARNPANSIVLSEEWSGLRPPADRT